MGEELVVEFLTSLNKKTENYLKDGVKMTFISPIFFWNFQSTELDLFPHSLLGSTYKRAPYYNPKEKFYFFPRNADIFPAIHYYFRSNGILQRPAFVGLRRFIDEVEFFQLGREAIIPLLEEEGIFIVETPEPASPRQKYWFHVFENLEYNMLAKIIAVISILATSTSVLVFCVETLEQFQVSIMLCQPCLFFRRVAPCSKSNTCFMLFPRSKLYRFKRNYSEFHMFHSRRNSRF